VRSAIPYAVTAELLRARGDAGLATKYAERAVALMQGLAEEPVSLTALARAHARSGRRREAEATLARATRNAEGVVGWLPRDWAYARGVVALDLGDPGAAIQELSKAQQLLAPRAAEVLAPGSHVVTWYELARAYQLAGRDREAAQWFERITATEYEHIFAAVQYVRSFYFLAQLQEKGGDLTKARESYRRFVELWKNGDMDRDRIAEAERKLGS
jgi:tetratricopeptide (TPR) repeat protein